MSKKLTRVLFRGIGPNTVIHYLGQVAKNGDSPTIDGDVAISMIQSGYAIPYTEKDSELVIRRETADNNKRAEIAAKVATQKKEEK